MTTTEGTPKAVITKNIVSRFTTEIQNALELLEYNYPKSIMTDKEFIMYTRQQVRAIVLKKIANDIELE